MKKTKNIMPALAALAGAALMLTGCNAMKNMCGKPHAESTMKAHPAGCACSQCSAMK